MQFIILPIPLLLIIILISDSNSQTNLERRTKLCADPKCQKDLFPSTSIRDFLSQDPLFLQHTQNKPLKVFAFKLSNRPDLMEAEMDDARRGYIYNGHIDLAPYVIFLEGALKRNITLYLVDQDNGKLIREISAIPELARDYSAYAMKIEGYQLDKELVAMLLAQEKQQGSNGKDQQKARSHGHGHSHEHGHGHSHEHVEPSKEKMRPAEEVVNEKENLGQKQMEVQQQESSANNLPKEEEEKGKAEEKKASEEKNPKLAIEKEPSGRGGSQSELADGTKKVEEEKPPPPKTDENATLMRKEEGQESAPAKAAGEGADQQNADKTLPDGTQAPNPVYPAQDADQSPPEQQNLRAEVPPLKSMEEAKLAVEEGLQEEIVGHESQMLPPVMGNPVLENVIRGQNAQPEKSFGADQPEGIDRNIGEAQTASREGIQAEAPPPNHDPIVPLPPAPMPVEAMEQQLAKANPPLESIPNTLPVEQQQQQQAVQPKEELADNVWSKMEVPSPSPLPNSVPTQSLEEVPQSPHSSANSPVDKEEEPAQQSAESAGAGGEGEKLDNNKFCFKDDCRGLDLDELPSDTRKPSFESSLREMFRHTMASIRALLPEPLCSFEDTGLIVLAFVLVTALIHLINTLLSKNSGPEPVDHRLLHDCVTRLKEQELIIEQQRAKVAENQHLVEVAKAAEQLQKENKTLAEKLGDASERTSELEAQNGSMKQTLKSIHHELGQNKEMVEELRRALETRDAEFKRVSGERQRVEADLDETGAKLAQAQHKEKYLEADLKEALAQADQLKTQLEVAQAEAGKWRNECAEKKAEVDELLGIIAEMNTTAILAGDSRRGSKRGSSAEVEGEGGKPPEEKKTKKAGKEKKNGDKDNGSSNTSSGSSPGQLLDVGELGDPDNGVGSGGSAGWSDLGDGVEVAGTEREKKHSKEAGKEEEEEVKAEGGSASKLLDILEMAKLKSRLRSLETEREQLKFSLKMEREEKEVAQKDLERLRQELVERERDSEQRELDRHGLTQQCTKLLQMIEEKERKVENSEQERERLRQRLADVDLELRRVGDERKEVQQRQKEMEATLRRTEDLNSRLENKLYHEERRLQSRIRQLEEQLSLAKSSLSPMNLSGGGMSSDLNMSGNSSDREFVPLNSPGGGDEGRAPAGQQRGGGMASLWSEIDVAEPVDELVSLERKGGGSVRRRRSIRTGAGGGEAGTLVRESPFFSDLVHVSSNGHEERRLMNTSKYSASSSVAGANRQRMRSRSAGRQSARLTGVSTSAAVANPLLYGTIGHSASLYASHHRSSVVPQSGKNSPFRQQMPERPHSAARLRGNFVSSASAAAAYSSDSNGASSPPPEMPLLSGVPPPGLNKRPAVVFPAKMNVQLHKPAAPHPK